MILLLILFEFSVLLRDVSVPVLKRNHYYTQGNIVIESIDHQTRNVIENKPFSRYEGEALGLDKYLNFSSLDFIEPFVMVSSITSGDFNNDGWQDIVLGDRKGILLYKNIGGRFTLQETYIPEIKDLNVIVVAFVDINNDGWQDIYITTYGGENYFVVNDKKGFRNPEVLKAPNKEAEVTLAASFGDLNRDGYLDFINGNGFSLSSYIPIYEQLEAVPPYAANVMVMNKELDFKEYNYNPNEVVGQSLSVLLADFTNDHNLDLIIGNDLQAPDVFYTGNSTGAFRKILKVDGLILVSVHDNMSVDVADFNNDLYMDIYAVGRSSLSNFLPRSFRDRGEQYCFEIKNSEERQKCKNNLRINKVTDEGDIEQCDVFEQHKDKNDCLVMTILRLATSRYDKSFCEKIPADYKMYQRICHKYFGPRNQTYSVEEDVEQKEWDNVLLQGSSGGVFQDVSQETNSEDGRWGWNAKFADLDNDEWQDIYVANGEFRFNPAYSNIFFHNYEGQFFKAEQENFNLENYNMVTAYTYIDIDNDGDLDIISAGLNGPINVYINNEMENNSITFEFRDQKGNHFGIENKIYIYYGESNERHQVRQIKSGGGFLSFDSPIAHFGLGKYDIVNRVEIVWSTGEKTIIDKEFLVNKQYVILRNE